MAARNKPKKEKVFHVLQRMYFRKLARLTDGERKWIRPASTALSLLTAFLGIAIALIFSVSLLYLGMSGLHFWNTHY